MVNPRGRGRGGRGRGGGYYTPQAPKKRLRFPSDEQEEGEVEIDPELLLDSLLACLTKKESLIDRFITHLLKVPSLQDKIAQMVMSSSITDSEDSTVNVDSSSSTDGDTTKTSIANSFISTIQELTSAVNELKTELKSSAQRCDDLEQYSRRNNIVIAGVPESEHTSTETQVINILNDYVDDPITPNDIDRCHRLRKNPKNPSKTVGPPKTPEIIVKFVSHKSKASIMTKDPMEKLRNDNKTRSESSKIYIREDLTKKRATVLYKTRQLKKSGLIKHAFTRDGTITIRLPPIKPLGKDRYYRITNEEELKTFCSNSKLEVNSDCLPVTKGKLSSTFASIITGAPSTSALPMESQDSQSDIGAFDEASSSKV